ncbi:hypothetical protein IPJ70_02540 [Candidatus Campbellbacteria bacterium]|nr:MAG: hypothetical protein IPJ70_02540 [Candidatus Campbellbacteria bacterium]
MNNFFGIKTELLNLITGLLLVVSGVLNLFQTNFEMGINWIVFGAMYLIMDDYMQNKNTETFLEKMTDAGRIIFSWVGLLCSLFLIAYYITLFW